MVNSWRLAGRGGLALPTVEKAGPYGRLIRCWVIVVVCFAGLGAAAGLDNEYSLGTSSLVRDTAFGYMVSLGAFEADTSGQKMWPSLMGDLPTARRPLNDAELLIVSWLTLDNLKISQISAEVINDWPFYIIGEVANPGNYPNLGEICES
jgi:polysaccharide export outer membrane protein